MADEPGSGKFVLFEAWLLHKFLWTSYNSCIKWNDLKIEKR